MARNQVNVHVGNDQWYELTAGDSTNITFQTVSDEDYKKGGVYIRVTSGGNPGSASYGLLYRPGTGELNRPLAQLAIGLSNPTRVWAKAVDEPVVVNVSDDSV